MTAHMKTGSACPWRLHQNQCQRLRLAGVFHQNLAWVFVESIGADLTKGVQAAIVAIFSGMHQMFNVRAPSIRSRRSSFATRPSSVCLSMRWSNCAKQLPKDARQQGGSSVCRALQPLGRGTTRPWGRLGAVLENNPLKELHRAGRVVSMNKCGGIGRRRLELLAL